MRAVLGCVANDRVSCKGSAELQRVLPKPETREQTLLKAKVEQCRVMGDRRGAALAQAALRLNRLTSNGLRGSDSFTCDFTSHAELTTL